MSDQGTRMEMLPSSERASSRKPMVYDDTMRFGVFWPYSKTLFPSRLLAEKNPDVLLLENHVELAKACEAVGMDFIVIADGYAPNSEGASEVGFQDPRTHAVLWAVPILLATRKLGVISTVHTTYVHPVQMARYAGHLDCLSGGRWGWNIVHGFRDHEARLFGFDGLPDHDAMIDRADEYMAVVKKLWSEEPVHHQGEHFKVVGKLAGPRLAGPPLLVNAAGSGRGRRFAIEHCDYLFTSMPREGWDGFRTFLKETVETANRPHPPGVLVMGDLLLRSQPGAAQEEREAITASLDEGVQKAWRAHTTAGGKKTPPQALQLVGTPAEVADRICALYNDVGLRGVLFRMPLWHVSELDLMPELFERLKQAGVWVPPDARGHSW